MRKVFYFFVIPVFCFSSLVLMVHDLLPSIWRKLIRPTVVNLRKNIKHVFITRSSKKERKEMTYEYFFSVFEKRRFAIIRLIRLVSDSKEIISTNDVFRFEKGRRLYLNWDNKTSFSFV